MLYLTILLIPSLLFAQEDESSKLQWPRKIVTEQGTITIYQPQVEKFEGNKLEARAALSVTTEQYKDPVFGAAWFDCVVETDRDERMVSLKDLEVPNLKFPGISDKYYAKITAILEEEIPAWEITLSLDRLLADLDRTNTEDAISSGFNNEPPEIIYRQEPAVLILIDGDPILKETTEKGYQYIVNTPFFIIYDEKDKQYYLKGSVMWFSSANVMSGWRVTEDIPKKIIKLSEVTRSGEDGGEQIAEDPDHAALLIPEIIVRTQPAELILTSGDPDFAAVEGTSLLYLRNTDSDILMDIESQQYYILISGRWYASKSLSNGPWTFVEPDKVPEDFSAIPANSDIGNVRASVAGTDEAREAVIDNSIPQTATVDRASATVEVTYDGQPEFEAIEGTDMQYALNTDKSVLKIDGIYYCVDDGVWFESSKPTGPWKVSTQVPETVQDIPPESPVYNVKYVYIYDYTPEVVYVGYTPGYVHSYIYGGCVYYGTGWYYRPWYGAYYYPRPVTYGFGVHYNSYTGWGFSFGVSVGGPAGWFSVGFHSPRYGYWGPAGYRYGYNRGYATGYNRGYYQGARAGYRAGQASAQTRPARNNIYADRGNGVRQTAGRTYNPRSGIQLPSTREANRQVRSPQPATRERNNVYTDRNGDIYRKEGDRWQQRQGNQWKDAPNAGTRDIQSRDRQAGNTRDRYQQQPQTRDRSNVQNNRSSQNVNRQQQTPSNNLDRDFNQRNRGTQRTQQYNNNRQNYQRSTPSGMNRNARPAAGRAGGRR